MWHVYTSLPGQIHSSCKSLFQLSLFSSRERSAPFKLQFILCLIALAYWFSFLDLVYSVSVIVYEYFFFVFLFPAMLSQLSHLGALGVSEPELHDSTTMEGSGQSGSWISGGILLPWSAIPARCYKSDKSPLLSLSYQSCAQCESIFAPLDYLCI